MKRRSRVKNLEAIEPSSQTPNNPPQPKMPRDNHHAVLKSVEKYLSLAREAVLQNDRVLAESYYQYAEHYMRLSNDKR